MKRLILIAPLLLMGCRPEQRNDSVVVTDFSWQNSLRTIKHDGHSFVVVMDREVPQGLIHHPSCECLKEAQ